MSLKFDILNPEGRYVLRVSTDESTTEVQANERELRRLMIDLEHEFADD